METNTLILLSFKMLDLKLQLGLSLCVSGGVECFLLITGRLLSEDITHLPAASSQCDDKLWRNPSHSWKLRGPRLQRRAPGPLDTNHTDVYSIVSLLLSLPFPPSSPPFSLCLCFFPPLHFDTPSLALSESLAVHLKSGFTAGKHS